MQHPGDIDLFADGMYQRLEDRVLEVSWKDIRSWKGLVCRFQGETYSKWYVVCSQQVSRRASQGGHGPMEWRDRKCFFRY